MVAYSFNKRFIGPIQSGRKQQTIRPPRKRHARPGEEVHLYTGMRTRHCKLIGRYTCFAVQMIEINFDDQSIDIDGMPVDDIAAFARLDGFDGDDPHHAMREFFTSHYGHGSPWQGFLIRWRP